MLWGSLTNLSTLATLHWSSLYWPYLYWPLFTSLLVNSSLIPLYFFTGHLFTDHLYTGNSSILYWPLFNSLLATLYFSTVRLSLEANRSPTRRPRIKLSKFQYRVLTSRKHTHTHTHLYLFLDPEIFVSDILFERSWESRGEQWRSADLQSYTVNGNLYSRFRLMGPHIYD